MKNTDARDQTRGSAPEPGSAGPWGTRTPWCWGTAEKGSGETSVVRWLQLSRAQSASSDRRDGSTHALTLSCLQFTRCPFYWAVGAAAAAHQTQVVA